MGSMRASVALGGGSCGAEAEGKGILQGQPGRQPAAGPSPGEGGPAKILTVHGREKVPKQGSGQRWAVARRSRVGKGGAVSGMWLQSLEGWVRLEPGVPLDEPGGPFLQSSDGLEAPGRPGHS